MKLNGTLQSYLKFLKKNHSHLGIFLNFKNHDLEKFQENDCKPRLVPSSQIGDYVLAVWRTVPTTDAYNLNNTVRLDN